MLFLILPLKIKSFQSKMKTNLNITSISLEITVKTLLAKDWVMRQLKNLKTINLILLQICI